MHDQYVAGHLGLGADRDQHTELRWWCRAPAEGWPGRKRAQRDGRQALKLGTAIWSLWLGHAPTEPESIHGVLLLEYELSDRRLAPRAGGEKIDFTLSYESAQILVRCHGTPDDVLDQSGRTGVNPAEHPARQPGGDLSLSGGPSARSCVRR